MKKTYSKTDLEKKVDAFFKTHPSALEAHATTDGYFFLNKNRANLHAGPKGNVFTFENENNQDNEADKPKKQSASELINSVAKIEGLDVLNKILDLEVAGKNRTTVVDAVTKRIEALTKED